MKHRVPPFRDGTNADPATASVLVIGLPISGNTVTINGDVYTAGTEFKIGKTFEETARNLCFAVNSDPDEYPEFHNQTQPVRKYFAMRYGALVRLIAVKPGTGGNSYTLATSNSGAFTVSGSNFAGGAA